MKDHSDRELQSLESQPPPAEVAVPQPMTQEQLDLHHLTRVMSPQHAKVLRIERLSAPQPPAMVEWGSRMFGLGQHVSADIEEVRYEGRLIILSDGTRWAVDSLDADTADLWNMMDHVVVIDDVMYNLEGAEHVDVEQEDE